MFSYIVFLYYIEGRSIIKDTPHFDSFQYHTETHGSMNHLPYDIYYFVDPSPTDMDLKTFSHLVYREALEKDLLYQFRIRIRQFRTDPYDIVDIELPL